MTSKSLFSENKESCREIRKGTGGLLPLIRQNLSGNLWLIVVGLIAMLFNYPVNMAVQLSTISARYAAKGVSLSSALYAAGAEGSSLLSGGDAASKAAEQGVTPALLGQQEKLLREIGNAANGVLLGTHTLIAFLIPVAAVVCAFAMFRYLYSREQTDFYHSLPVRREKRFAAHYLSGALIMAGSYLLGLLGAFLIAGLFRAKGLMFREILLMNAGFLLMFFLHYSVALLAMLLAGTLPAGVLLTGWIYGVGPFAATVFSLLKSSCFSTLWDPQGAEQKLWYLSPVKYLLDFYEYVMLLAGRNNYTRFAYDRRLAALLPSVWRAVLLAAALTLLCTVLALWVYRKRRSESAGSALAFAPVKRPFRVISTVLGALAMSLIGAGFESLFWMLFFVLAGTVLIHGMTEALIQLDVRRALCHKAELLLCAVLGILTVLGFYYDVAGYDRHVPKAESVVSASVDTGLYRNDYMTAAADVKERYGSLSDGSFDEETAESGSYYYDRWADEETPVTDPAVLEKIRALAEAGSRTVHAKFDQSAVLDVNETETFYVMICWKLKNGNTDKRRYYIARTPETEQLADEIFRSQEFKEAEYPILGLDSAQAGLFALVPGGETAGNEALLTLPEIGKEFDTLYYRVQRQEICDLSALSEEFEKQLLAALQEDIRNMSREEADAMNVAAESDAEDADQGDYLLYVPQEELRALELRRERTERQIAAGLLDRENISDPVYDYYDIYRITDGMPHVRKLLAENGLQVSGAAS